MNMFLGGIIYFIFEIGRKLKEKYFPPKPPNYWC